MNFLQKLRALSTIIVMLCLSSCGALPASAATEKPAPLLNTVWGVAELSAGEFITPTAAPLFFLQLKPNGRFRAYAGCNVLSGDYVRSGNALRLGPFDDTPLLCTPAQLTTERAIMHAIEGGSRYRIEASRLSLLNPIGVALIRFVAQKNESAGVQAR